MVIGPFARFLLDLISYCVFAASAVSAKIAEEIKKLEADARGCYSLKFSKPDDKYTAQVMF